MHTTGNHQLNTLTIPISVKGIVFEGDQVWLRRNERDEWELPGGKLDRGEQPTDTVVRELSEELGFVCEVATLIDAHRYVVPTSIDEGAGVLVLAYLCRLIKKTGEFELIGEAGPSEFSLFDISSLENIRMPEFYRLAIMRAWMIEE